MAKKKVISRELFGVLFTKFSERAVKAQQTLIANEDLDNEFKLGFQNAIMNCMQYLCDAYNEMNWSKNENNK